MDLFGVIWFGIFLILAFRNWYEVWFTPEKFHKRLARRRNSAKKLFWLFILESR